MQNNVKCRTGADGDFPYKFFFKQIQLSSLNKSKSVSKQILWGMFWVGCWGCGVTFPARRKPALPPSSQLHNSVALLYIHSLASHYKYKYKYKYVQIQIQIQTPSSQLLSIHLKCIVVQNCFAMLLSNKCSQLYVCISNASLNLHFFNCFARPCNLLHSDLEEWSPLHVSF